MNYSLRQLEIFVSVCEHQSISNAAEHLNLTQPAVSIQLKKFQENFEIALTEIIGRKLFVTEFGSEILSTAKHILLEAEAINESYFAFKGLLKGKLKISIASTGKYVLPFFITDFSRLHENIEFEIDVSNKQSVLNRLYNQDIDFALISVLPDKVALNVTELMSNQLYLVGAPELAKAYNKSKASDQRWIYREQGSATRKAMEEFLTMSKIEPKKRMELISNEAVKQAVIAGLGLSVMPIIGLRNELANKQIEIIPAKETPITTNWNLVSVKGKALSPSAKAFIQFLEENKSQIIKSKFDWMDIV